MGTLQVRGLTKRFGSTVAVDHVDLQIQDDEFFVLLGPTDSGKSTLLRLICGLEKPDEGQIIIEGRDVTSLSANQRKMSMVFQNHQGLYPHMTVYDNIAFALKAFQMTQEGVKMHVLAAAHTLEITHLLKRKITHLSHGELQRVALARILVKKPEFYLFDEPLVHLDMLRRMQARREILMIHRLMHKPCIYATQDQTEASILAQRVAVIAQGQIQQVGIWNELLHMPENIFVAQFVHTPPMNLLRGYLQSIYHQGELLYRVLGRCIDPILPNKWTKRLMEYGFSDVIFGFRPDAVVPEWAFVASNEVSYCKTQVEILEVEPLTAMPVVKLKLETECEITGKFYHPPEDKMQVGEVITIGIDPQCIHLFHVQTHRSLLSIYE